MAVSPIPEGYHTITPHLVCKNAARAIEFYKKAFGAEELFRMPGPGGAVMHAELKIGDSMIMLGEEMPGMATSPQTLGGASVTLNLYVKDADAVFQRATGAGAKVIMPLADMFWGDRWGKLSDPFGHHWSVATHIKDLSPEEMEKAAAAAMANMKPGSECGKA